MKEQTELAFNSVGGDPEISVIWYFCVALLALVYGVVLVIRKKRLIQPIKKVHRKAELKIIARYQQFLIVEVTVDNQTWFYLQSPSTLTQIPFQTENTGEYDSDATQLARSIPASSAVELSVLKGQQ
jgi:hypothetical protein